MISRFLRTFILFPCLTYSGFLLGTPIVTSENSIPEYAASTQDFIGQVIDNQKLPTKFKGFDPFGSILDDLYDRVDDTIQNAINELNNSMVQLVILVGQELTQAINQVKMVYETELKKTLDEINAEAKAALDRLNSMVNDFENKTVDELGTIMGEAQELINTLPMANTHPQLIGVKPHYLILSDEATVVNFHGNFLDSATPGYEPSLVFNGQTCVLQDSHTDTLSFLVPSSIFKDAQGNKFSFASGQLHVQWNNGYWWWPEKAECVYQVTLGALPYWAGWGVVGFDQTYPHVSFARLTNFQINWKDHLVFSPLDNEFISKLVFVDYTGTRLEFSSPNREEGILKIDAQGMGAWEMWAELPKNLETFASELRSKFVELIKKENKTDEEYKRTKKEILSSFAELVKKAKEKDNVEVQPNIDIVNE